MGGGNNSLLTNPQGLNQTENISVDPPPHIGSNNSKISHIQKKLLLPDNNILDSSLLFGMRANKREYEMDQWKCRAQPEYKSLCPAHIEKSCEIWSGRGPHRPAPAPRSGDHLYQNKAASHARLVMANKPTPQDFFIFKTTRLTSRE